MNARTVERKGQMNRWTEENTNRRAKEQMNRRADKLMNNRVEEDDHMKRIKEQ